MANICIVNGSGGELSLKLMVNNGGQTAGKFWLWKHNGTTYEPVEKLKGATDEATGEVTIDIGTESIQFEGLFMTWLLQTCARIPSANKLTIKIHFLQDNVKLKTTSDIRYTKEYPKCSDGEALQNSGEVQFTIIEEPITTRLWESM